MPEASRAFPENKFIYNLLVFGQVLRSAGMDIPPYRMGDVLSALEYIDITNKQDVYYALRSLLVYDHLDYPVFEQAFNEFWKAWQHRWRAMSLPPVKAPHRPKLESQSTGEATSADPLSGSKDQPSSPEMLVARTTYSQNELLRQKDFAALTPQETQSVYRLIETLDWTPAERKTRRFRSGTGSQLDFRQTFRSNLRFGSEIVLLRKKTQRYKPRPIIILADVSGSMQAYSKILMHFIFSITAKYAHPVESFIFSTRLTRITPYISKPRFEHAMRAISSQVHTWSGGTRIGAALRTFNVEWTWRLNAQNAAILLISDGWDRGDPDALTREIAHLHRCAHQLIWLNPLLGSPDYQPLTRGMQAALPHIDRFLPAHNLASLEELAEVLTMGLKHSPFVPPTSLPEGLPEIPVD
ncbi:MAG: VWA domain-containing protein [Anaerolineales bacterium]